jgi:hypothetical protein
VTTKLRQDEFPAASVARTMTVVRPGGSGTAAFHCEVPVAVPLPPEFVDQATDATPTLSVAVPEIRIEARDVEADVPAGEAMLRDGAVLSGAGGGLVRSIATAFDTCALPLEAVNVIVLGPGDKPTPFTVQAAPFTAAAPDAPPEDRQDTAAAPVTVPAREIDAP